MIEIRLLPIIKEKVMSDGKLRITLHISRTSLGYLAGGKRLSLTRKSPWNPPQRTLGSSITVSYTKNIGLISVSMLEYTIC